LYGLKELRKLLSLFSISSPTNSTLSALNYLKLFQLTCSLTLIASCIKHKNERFLKGLWNVFGKRTRKIFNRVRRDFDQAKDDTFFVASCFLFYV